MRTAFIEELFGLAQEDPNLVLMVGDLGFGVVTRFMEELPRQYVNAGVAEQNMTGMAAGMALSGKTVFTYSIANFPTLRCLEQIRNDICYHQANVKIVSVGGGVAYGSLGPSHHATEDIAVMRALPGLTVVAPGDPVEARLCTAAVAAYRGPVYMRLGRAGEPRVHESVPVFEIGKAITVREGRDVALVATGGMLYDAVRAAEMLGLLGIGARVISMHTIAPIDAGAVRAAAQEAKALFTIEEHSIVGGLGSAVSEVLMESRTKPARFKRIGLPNEFTAKIGDRDYLRAHYGLNADGIVRTVNETLSSGYSLSAST